MFATLGQPKEFKQLYQFTKNLRDISKRMLERAKAASEFGKSLLLIMKLEAPKYSIYFEPLMKEYEKLSISYATAAKIQYFAMEDLNDIIVRFPIVQRKEQEKVKLIQAYNSSNKKYKEAKLLLKKSSSQENNMNFIKTRNDRAIIAEKLIEKSDDCISYQSRFDRFVQNRSSSAWKRYSLSMEKLYREETEIMERLISYCSIFKNNVDNPEKILSMIEEANKSLKINKSAPVINTNSVHLTHKTQQQQNPKEQQSPKEQQIKLKQDNTKDEEFKRLTESMELDFKGGFDLTGINFSNSDASDDNSDNSIGGNTPVDLHISHMDDDEFIRDLLGSK